jgi:predicted SAM-dependent methyltransferase
MKVNLGSGFKRIEGFVNVDDDPLVEPDYLVNIEAAKLPFDDNSVEEIRAHHILEHIGEGFIPLMKELHRVCKHGALLDIVVPHHFHDNFYGDPTHKRAITVSGMYLFSKKHCEEHKEAYGSSSGMALKYGIDFDIEWYDFEYDPFYQGMVDMMKQKTENGTMTHDEQFMFRRLMREANNVALHTMIKMRAVKE